MHQDQPDSIWTIRSLTHRNHFTGLLLLWALDNVLDFLLPCFAPPCRPHISREAMSAPPVPGESSPASTPITDHSRPKTQSTIATETANTFTTFDPYREESITNNSPKPPVVPQPNRRKHTQIIAESPRTMSLDAGGQEKRHPQGAKEQTLGWFHEPVPTPPTKPLSPLRLKLWLGMCIAFTILAPVISIVLGVTAHSREMSYPGTDAPPFDGRTVSL